MIVHGGDLDAAVRNFGLERDKIKDFSANINPFGLSPKVKKAITDNVDMVKTYPDVNYAALKKSISRYINTPVENIIVGNGSTELISLFIKNTAKNALIVAPAYSEYEREVKIAGGCCEYFALEEKDSFNLNIKELCGKLTKKINLLIMCNPNNPTGTAVSVSDMKTIADVCLNNGVNMLIDETYCEFSDVEKYSSIPLVKQYNNIFVIRGIAKFFAAPGLRLGYGVSSENIIKTLSAAKDPWSVNILAAIAGEYIFTDDEYILNTKTFIAKERARLFNELSSWKNIRVYESCANFLLFKLLNGGVDSAGIFTRLIKKGIMIRDASGFKFLDKSFLRFCFLNEADNTLLLNELRCLL